MIQLPAPLADYKDGLKVYSPSSKLAQLKRTRKFGEVISKATLSAS
jgi:hypothetical protein